MRNENSEHPMSDKEMAWHYSERANGVEFERRIGNKEDGYVWVPVKESEMFTPYIYYRVRKSNQELARQFINANVWDGQDMTGNTKSWAKFTPDDLYELIHDLLEHLEEYGGPPSTKTS